MKLEQQFSKSSEDFNYAAKYYAVLSLINIAIMLCACYKGIVSIIIISALTLLYVSIKSIRCALIANIMTEVAEEVKK